MSGAALAGAGLGRNTPKPGEKNDKKWLPLSDGYRFFFLFIRLVMFSLRLVHQSCNKVDDFKKHKIVLPNKIW